MGKEGNLDWAPVLSFVKQELNKFPSFLRCLKDFVCKDPSVANTSCSGVTQKKVQALGLTRGSAGEYQQMSRQVSRGSAGEYQADEQAGVARLSWRVSGR